MRSSSLPSSSAPPLDAAVAASASASSVVLATGTFSHIKFSPEYAIFPNANFVSKICMRTFHREYRSYG